jgi:hypothetical protein
VIISGETRPEEASAVDTYIYGGTGAACSPADPMGLSSSMIHAPDDVSILREELLESGTV